MSGPGREDPASPALAGGERGGDPRGKKGGAWECAPRGRVRTVAVSGGFDPLHIGHVRLFREARKLGERLVVILNNDHWLLQKKGYIFMPQEERAEILRALRPVDEVVITAHPPRPSDMSVCEELERLRPSIFANGGDRKAGNTPEYALCERLGIRMVFNVGLGGKVQSSSELVRRSREALARQERGAVVAEERKEKL